MFANLSFLLPLWSVGAGYAQSHVLDASQLATQVSSYEIFAQTYASTPVENIVLRPALRFAYEPESSDESPYSLSIRERTIKSAAEISILYNGVLIPTMTIQGAYLARRLTLQRQAPVVSSGSNDLTRNEFLGQAAVAFALGIPLAQGSFLIEPFYRLIKIQKDGRQSTQWGMDLSYALPITRENNE